MSLPSNVAGPFSKLKFLGATVSNFSIGCNWGDQSSFFNCTLVEDPADDDYFIYQAGEVPFDGGQAIGTAHQITYGGFTFGGIIKSIDKIEDIENYPTYKVVLVTPVEVLDAVQVVLAGYVGPNNDLIFSGFNQGEATFKVNNLLNIYGWAEAGGSQFGRSQSTDIGMPWTGTFGIAAGLEFLTNINDIGPTENNYGSVIKYKGNTYRLDLSGLPIPPSFYRIGGVVNMSLLDLLNRFFEDAGVSWIVKLTVNPYNQYGPHTISFSTFANYVQQPLSRLADYVANLDNVSHKSMGQELRSDITQSFLVGGNLNLLQPIQNGIGQLNILPFFGFDFQGKPIIGINSFGTQTADDSLQFNLNATSVADIMGELGFDLSYPCSILEFRCALGNYDTWASYIQLAKPDLVDTLRMYGAWDLTVAQDAETFIDLLNDNSNYVTSLNNMFVNNHWPTVAQRLYEFVRGQAEVYYGKKFIVILPFQEQIYVDPTTGTITLANELCDAGYAPEGEQILGLNFVNENYFLDQTGRFYPFVQYQFYSQFNSVAGPKVVSPNVAYLKGTSTVVQYNTNPQFAYVYQRCEQGDEAPVTQNGQTTGGSPIFFINTLTGASVAAMIVSVPDVVWAQADDITGSMNDLANMMNIPLEILQDIAFNRSDSFDLIIHPPAYYPAGIAVALKSNQILYGPWGKYTSDGKLNFEKDDGLVPWEYGSYANLTQAAIAKLNTIATGNQVLERGEVLQAGIPEFSVGDIISKEGPLLTGVECSISTSQVTTTYTLQTFVNRAGAFIIENQERLRRIGKYYQQLRRTIRQQILTTIDRASLMMENYKGFMYGTSYAVQQHTPHAVLGARLYPNSSGTYTPFAWTQTYKESLANLGLNSVENFQSTACVGMEGLLRPYTTNKFSDALPIMPGTDENIDTKNLITGLSGLYGLNPLQSGCDINWLLSGDSYTTIKTSKGLTDYNNARSVALRGPLMVCGWGYDLQGYPIPNSGAIVKISGVDGYTVDFQTALTGCSPNKFIPDYLQLSTQWPAAPLDIVYDKFRGVWASQGMILHGVNSGTIMGISGGNYMELYVNNKPTYEFIQYSDWLGSVPTGVRMQVGWNPMERMWEAISAACSN